MLSSCISFKQYPALRPVSPVPAACYGKKTLCWPETVDSLQPTLVWQAVADPATTYDLVIVKAKTTGPIPRPGEQVYYREHLEGASHHVESPLLPKTLYLWSVRTRADVVGPWSTFNFEKAEGIRREWAHGALWQFQTPDQRSSAD